MYSAYPGNFFFKNFSSSKIIHTIAGNSSTKTASPRTENLTHRSQHEVKFHLVKGNLESIGSRFWARFAFNKIHD